MPRLAVARRLSSLPKLTRVESPYCVAQKYPDAKAITDQYGVHTYDQVWRRSVRLAKDLRKSAGGGSLAGQRIVYLTDNDSSNTVIRWAAWLNRAIAVPLCPAHPISEQRYFVEDSRARLTVGTEKYGEELTELCADNSSDKVVLPDDPTLLSLPSDPHDLGDLQTEFDSVDRCLIIYTSGTTGRPKGVVHTHSTINANVLDLANGWRFSQSDVVLHTLPLHHIHGLLKLLVMPQSLGAHCVMLPRFDPAQVWDKLLDGDAGVTVFSGVPTIYIKLLQYLDERGHDTPGLSADKIKSACQAIRLMISGSAPLPAPASDRWHALTGHRLLDRYGMTEVLLALSNPYDGPRKSSAVGHPFPSFTTLIAREDNSAPLGYVDVTDERDAENPECSAAGELYIKGPTVFREYWGKPDATRQVFTEDGWFKTGDTACKDKDGYYRILGRTSVDIIKSGGYKISALDIENKILQHPEIAECAVVGLPDAVYGERVAALLVLRPGSTLTSSEFLDWVAERLPRYQLPRNVLPLQEIPKNAMGKVNKTALRRLFDKQG